MKFKSLIPNIFYSDIAVGLKLFVDCLGFEITYNDLDSPEHSFCVIERNNLKAYLVQSAEYAAKDRPELRMETNNIREVYERVKSGFPELLHPNLNEVKLQPWDAQEFALLDESGVCIIIQQWPETGSL